MNQILLIVFLCQLFSLEPINAQSFSWSPSSTISPSLSSENVATCYDTAHNRIFSAWIDLNTFYPVYSIYENGSWSVPALIDPSMTTMGLRSIYLCYDTNNDRVFASWNDTQGINFYPAYSIYSGGSWSAPALISTNVSLVGTDVFVSYNSNANQVFATWASDTGTPTYSIYSSGIWSIPASIALGGAAGFNVYTVFDQSQNQMIATWADLNNGSIPAYSFFNGSNWSVPLNIGTGNTDNVFPCYNHQTHEIFATWIDYQNNDYPTYSIFNGSTWTNPTVIAPIEANGFAVSLFTCYDSIHNQIFAAWANTPNCDPTYSIYSNGVWSSPAFINQEPPGVYGDVFLTYNPITDKVFATWTDCITSAPYYSIYSNTQPINPIQPPVNLSARKGANRFLTKTEWFVELSWNAPTSGPQPSSYRIYRNDLNTLIGVVSVNEPYRFIDQNRKKKKTYIYYVISVDAVGNSSSPAVVSIKI